MDISPMTILAPTQTPDRKPLIILIDGHSLAFRAYYAFTMSKSGALRTSSGIPTSVCFGFLNALIQVIESQQPQSVAIAFDRIEPSFRQQVYPEYKANRKETPEEFIPDIKNLQEILTALNLKIVTLAGYEADDLLGTLSQQASQEGYTVKILSGDQDLFQLINPEKDISILYLDRNPFKSPNTKGYTEVDPAFVSTKLGVKPSQIIDYKALCGDKSDHIPGVFGIGEKTAVSLLGKYESLAGIYENLSEIKGAVKTKLEKGEDSAKQSQYLATIALDAPLEINLEDCRLQGFDIKAVQPLLDKLELRKFLDRIQKIQGNFRSKITADSPQKKDTFEPEQLSLFQSVESAENPQAYEPFLEETASILTPEIIDTSEKLNTLIERLKTFTDPGYPIAWDTETTDLDPRKAKLVGIGCCWGEQIMEIAYIPVNHRQGQQLEEREILDALRLILEDSRYPKVFQNAKFDRKIFAHQGINLGGVVFDTLLASYVLHPEHSHKLSDLCYRYLSGIVSQNYADLNIGKNQTIADLPITKIAHYCGMDAYSTFLLVGKLKAELEKYPDLNKLFLEVELPLEPVLAAMEDRGVRIDINYLKQLSKQLEKDLATLEKQAYEAAGESFNLGSPKQLNEILFDKLGLNVKKSRKTKTGYSTDHATLEKLKGDHPVIDYILEHRTLAKLKSTYVDALPDLADVDTQRIHTDFNQAVTATGRLSSSNPNLQNIPIRTEFSRQIRQAFIPQEGWILVSADYSQIELRILAHLSQEPVLLEAYKNYQDVHRVTAQLIFDKEDVTPRERNLGKTINFGVIYGMGAQRFARESGLNIGESKEFIEKYRQRYAHVFAYLEKVKKEAITQKFVTTILGRRRYFEFTDEQFNKLGNIAPEAIDLNALNVNMSDAQLLRAAANAPIQGSSADIIKIAMIKVQEILKNYRAKLLLQVHDELVFEVPPDEWETLQDKIKNTMENAVSLRVPLVVEIHAGNNWMEAK